MSELKTTSLSHKDNATGIPNITMYPDGTTSLNYAATGFKNLIINGDYRVWQRGSTFAAGTDQVYTADRWFGVKGSRGGSVSKAAISGIPNCAYAATIDMEQFYNNIELDTPGTGSDGRFINGMQYTLSFWSNAPVVNAQLVYRQGTSTPGADQAAASPAITANGDLQPVGPAIGSFQKYSHTFTITSQSLPNHTMLAVLLYNNTGAYSLTGCQLEPGPVASNFEFRFIGTELALCQRYYQAIYGANAGEPYLARNNAPQRNNGPSLTINFKTSMRVAPNPTLIGTWAIVNVVGQPLVNFTSTESATLYRDSDGPGDCYFMAKSASPVGCSFDAEL